MQICYVFQGAKCYVFQVLEPVVRIVDPHACMGKGHTLLVVANCPLNATR